MTITEKQELQLKRMLLYCLDYTDMKFLDIHHNIRKLFYKCWNCKTININEDEQCRKCGCNKKEMRS